MLTPKLDKKAFEFVRDEQSDALTRLNRGIEKESLRVTTKGYLSTRAHPESWGAALTNNYLTTDYSEALPELITPVSTDPQAPRRWLKDIHQFMYQDMADEVLWAGSMPCIMTREEDVPLADYGNSNVGQMKHIYRRGLGYRYGRYMQTIAGVHYNFSLPEDFWPAYQRFKQNSDPLPDFISKQYLGLIRNYLRYCWLLPYLFGASPAICKSFMKGRAGSLLEEFSECTLMGRYATSLRMSDLGYQNNAQSKFSISHNDINDYIEALEKAIRTKDDFYAELGVKVDGEYRQLNANLLQIENEYYAKIRPKRVIYSGERPTQALKRGGVQYVEVRSLDLNPFDSVGFSQLQIDFMDIFLLFCLLQESKDLSDRENAENDENFRRVVNFGRKPDLHLLMHNRSVSLKATSLDIFEQMKPIAELLDAKSRNNHYSVALKAVTEMAQDPNKTLSGQFMQQLSASGKGYYGFVYGLSDGYKQEFSKESLPDERRHFFMEEAQASIQKQKEIETAEHVSFDQYLESYFK
ncbi:glutamate--cysteine ligase [Kangiella sp. TOML190]|uniref:glutamate--cysteine ligase n=1 Tax=Kangiella sp. TOML190 TaxID=2931351 RepID=UPI00203AAEDF|nr:glutamate--cysteine ligase [Kangiella sp. TOML190]